VLFRLSAGVMRPPDGERGGQVLGKVQDLSATSFVSPFDLSADLSVFGRARKSHLDAAERQLTSMSVVVVRFLGVDRPLIASCEPKFPCD